MPSDSTTDTAAGQEQTPRERLVDELERRIGELESVDDAAVGHFTGVDWLLCTLGALVIPGFAMWWFAG